MSILDMDVTALRDPNSVKYREFARVRKGYDPDQVRAYLEQVSGWLQDLERDLRDARTTARMTARQPERPPEDQFGALGARVAEVLRTAEQHAEQVRREAEETAERTLEEARREAHTLRQTAAEQAAAARSAAEEESRATRRAAQDEADRAREEAARALETARVEAERTIAGLSDRRNALAAELHSTRERLMGIVTQLEDDSSAEAAAAQEADAWMPTASAEPASGPAAHGDPQRDEIGEIPGFVPPEPPVARATGQGTAGDMIDVGEAHAGDEDAEAGADNGTPSISWPEREGSIEDLFEDGGSIDLGFTDFPSFDIPSLEDDDQRN
jgi:DivIVA domain-containing protein